MIPRIPQPSIIPISDRGRHRYALEKDYTYRWSAEGWEWTITLPAGFSGDGASIPRLAWTLTGLTPDGLHRAGAWVHDWLYRHAGRLPPGSFCRLNEETGEWLPVDAPWTRKQADKLFANMLAAAGVSRFRRRMMYRAVRAFGWMHWRES